MGTGMLFDPALQKYWKEDIAGYESSLLVQEVKLVMAKDVMNELQEESSYNSCTRSEQSPASERSCSSW